MLLEARSTMARSNLSASPSVIAEMKMSKLTPV
jgi:hypothetical protein